MSLDTRRLAEILKAADTDNDTVLSGEELEAAGKAYANSPEARAAVEGLSPHGLFTAIKAAAGLKNLSLAQSLDGVASTEADIRTEKQDTGIWFYRGATGDLTRYRQPGF